MATKPRGTPLPTLPHKQLRAQLIAAYLRAAEDNSCVCFSCGNASRALKEAGLHVKEILNTDRWWRPEDIWRVWPRTFDATPGHLPAPLMVRLGQLYRQHLGSPTKWGWPPPWRVACGSGETLVCLALEYPKVPFVAVYNQGNPATVYHPEAPLNAWVEVLAQGPAMTTTYKPRARKVMTCPSCSQQVRAHTKWIDGTLWWVTGEHPCLGTPQSRQVRPTRQARK